MVLYNFIENYDKVIHNLVVSMCRVVLLASLFPLAKGEGLAKFSYVSILSMFLGVCMVIFLMKQQQKEL